jgi:hypothetical protein
MVLHQGHLILDFPNPGLEVLAFGTQREQIASLLLFAFAQRFEFGPGLRHGNLGAMKRALLLLDDISQMGGLGGEPIAFAYEIVEWSRILSELYEIEGSLD